MNHSRQELQYTLIFCILEAVRDEASFGEQAICDAKPEVGNDDMDTVRQRARFL